MSSENAVGFGFQTDTTALASASHMITGRVLKALSDGGVDIYAVISTIWLGQWLPVREGHEATLRNHIMNRSTFHSVLHRALSIGWGHSTAVIEMTRKRSGTNALLLVGALVTGSTPFQAAQCLSSLLPLSGFKEDDIPNVDVLRGMVAYLGPFVHDFGFTKVLEQINTTALRKARSMGMHDACAMIEGHGNSSGLSRIINQLIWTRNKKECALLVLNVRGSWVAAFATFIFGMSAELQLSGEILWEGAGESGKVIIQLGKSDPDISVKALSAQSTLTLVDCPPPPTGPRRVSATYLLGDIVEALIYQHPEIDAALKLLIQTAIVDAALCIRGRVFCCGAAGDSEKNNVIHQAFCGHLGKHGAQTLSEVLTQMGISMDSVSNQGWNMKDGLGVCDGKCSGVQVKGSVTIYHRPEHRHYQPYYGLGHMHDSGLEELRQRCPTHSKDHKGPLSISSECLCDVVGSLIFHFAWTAVVLSGCQFDPTQLRLGYDPSAAKPPERVFGLDYRGGGESNFQFRFREVLWLLLQGSGASRHEQSSPDYDVLGLSGGGYTVFYKGILETDCYDELGRFLCICTGYPSLNGSLRSILVENNTDISENTCDIGDVSTIAPGSDIRPCYFPSPSAVYMGASLQEDAISLRLRVGSSEDAASAVSLSRAIDTLHYDWSLPRCNHSRDSSFQLGADVSVAMTGLPSGQVNGRYPKAGVTIFALHGNKLQQILTCDLISNNFESRSLQSQSCLECCFKRATRCKRWARYGTCIVMGG